MAILLPAVIVLGLAVWLTPDPAGVGTHIQLGLAPCGFMSWLGWPCPMCGMTTTFSLMAHFRFMDAVANQPFGVVLYMITVIVAVIAALEIVCPQDRWHRVTQWTYGREIGLITGLFAGMMAAWGYKIAIMGQFFSTPP